jgi:hypothetical protein
MFARESLPLHPAHFPRLASCSLSFALALHFAPFHFNYFRTLSFSVSHLSRVLPSGCALFRKKPEVHPLVLPLSLPFPGTPFSRIETLSTCLPFTGRWPLSVTPFPAPARPREPSRGATKTSLLSPFATSLMQKQGGTGYWSYQSSLAERAGKTPPASEGGPYTRVLPPVTSHESPVTFRSPCPSPPFPLKWEIPFPVFTGENQ